MEEKKAILKHQASTVKGLDIIIVACLTLIFFVCPLFFTGIISPNLGLEKMVVFYFLVLIGTVAWVTKGVITGELSFKRTPLDWPILAMLVIFIVSTILSVSQKDSLIGLYGNPAKSLVAVFIFVIFYYLLINNLNAKRIKILFWALVAGTTLITIYSLLQLFGIFALPLDFTKTRAFNPLASLSGLTMFIVMMLPLVVLATAQLEEIHPQLKNKILKIAIKALLSLVGLAGLTILILLNGFTFWPAAIVGIVIVLMFLLSKIIKITNANLAFPIITFLLLIILLVLGNFNLMSLNLPVEVSLSRQASWEIAKTTVIKNPFFGSGLATYNYDFIKYKGTGFNASPLWNIRFDSATGVTSELLATTGGLGTLAIVVITLIALSLCFIALIKAIKDEIQSISLALFASFISILIFQVWFALNSSVFLLSIIFSILALAIAISLYPEKFKVLNLTFRASAKYALALAAIFLTVSAGVVILFTLGIKMYLADYFALKAVRAADLNQKVYNFNRAIQLAPYQDNYYVLLANNYMALANQEVMTGGSNQQLVENNLSLAIENAKKAVAIAPNNVSNNEAMALIYENASFYVRGALEWAETLYNKVITLEPDSPAPLVRLALINMARANLETDKAEQEHYINEALKFYDQAIAKKGDLGAAYYGKAIAYERLNKIDEAVENAKQAVIVTRDNIDYRFELGRLFFNRGVLKPNLAQTAAADITKGEGQEENLSVEPIKTPGFSLANNDDLRNAEQIFLSILQANPNHANALYSLGLVYQVSDEKEKAKIAIKSLLNLLTDQASIDAVKKQFVGLY